MMGGITDVMLKASALKHNHAQTQLFICQALSVLESVRESAARAEGSKRRETKQMGEAIALAAKLLRAALDDKGEVA